MKLFYDETKKSFGCLVNGVLIAITTVVSSFLIVGLGMVASTAIYGTVMAFLDYIKDMH